MLPRLKIKGRKIWMLSALLLIGIVFSFCHIKIAKVTIPASAKVGDVVPIQLDIDESCNSGGSDRLILGVLMPKGWKGTQNMTATYKSSKGDGSFTMVPVTTLAAHGDGKNWPDYMRATFGIAGNLIDDMEWVVMQSDNPFTYANGDKITGSIFINLKVGADDNPTVVKLAYVVANTTNGFTSDTYFDEGYGPTAEYYNQYVGDCFTVTGGSGDLVDFCNPQLTTIAPPKSLDNDLVTISFDSNVTETELSGSDEVYLCATGTTNDGKTITVCEQTSKTLIKAVGSGRYEITFWPRSFFGISDNQTLTNMTYFITDKTGTKQVGYGNTAAPFTYKFKCG
ncbi:DUF4961 domain-containing protein [Chitinophaga sancti]|uniref:DUF4961 domain-containing protein n=1 Tax=Chitinophaga sancti TaxID=1004 RepID=A0A1K1SJ91_9BACT|nr:DUF4961 domain-containing protein [Chitinophaga sancti]WQD64468.1 DUF4961 domain-containing protein [Chitinophaga sancti]WQG89908.1 DUF4961 domain-containing protein [Chitinophaga sancti]SFW84398.1 protein of unknown function [Chitinophaga sancti]